LHVKACAARANAACLVAFASFFALFASSFDFFFASFLLLRLLLQAPLPKRFHEELCHHRILRSSPLLAFVGLPGGRKKKQSPTKIVQLVPRRLAGGPSDNDEGGAGAER
jgi:hypothetical protein